MNEVRFLRVLGIRSRRPTVLAVVGPSFVRWDGRDWTCDCDLPDGASCEHVDLVVSMLDDRVCGGRR